MSDSITIGPGMQAFAKGVMTGERTAIELAKVTTTPQQLTRMFWLNIGTALATELPDAEQAVSEQFIAGASTREPAVPPVSLYLDTIDGVAFVGEQEDDERDDSSSRSEVARLLREAADKIADGYNDGVLFDYNGHKVGRFDYNPWS